MAVTELKKITNIGSVVIHRGTPPNGNPFLGFEWNACGGAVTHVGGMERVAALTAFKNGGDTSTLTFWYLGNFSDLCRYGLSERQITDPSMIDWSVTRIE